MRASTKSPGTWTTFEEALAEYQSGGADGVGFVFSKDDDYVGIDLDHIDSPELDAWAIEVVRKLDSYLEKSPSGTGYHVIARGTVPEGRKRSNVEMYDWGRYFTVTGIAPRTCQRSLNCDKLKSTRSTPSALPTRQHPHLCKPPRQRRTPPPSPTMTRSRASKLPTTAARCGMGMLVRTRRNPKQSSPCAA